MRREFATEDRRNGSTQAGLAARRLALKRPCECCGHRTATTLVSGVAGDALCHGCVSNRRVDRQVEQQRAAREQMRGRTR
jgi:hypothetical protein